MPAVNLATAASLHELIDCNYILISVKNERRGEIHASGEAGRTLAARSAPKIRLEPSLA